jgi:hypothetical protein
MQGDDMRLEFSYVSDALAMLVAWKYLGIVANERKFFIAKDRDEYLRLIAERKEYNLFGLIKGKVDSVVYGYPARITPSLWMAENPIDKKPFGPELLRELATKYAKAVRRGLDKEKIMNTLKAHIAQIVKHDRTKMKQALQWLATPSVLGGCGMGREGRTAIVTKQSMRWKEAAHKMELSGIWAEVVEHNSQWLNQKLKQAYKLHMKEKIYEGLVLKDKEKENKNDWRFTRVHHTEYMNPQYVSEILEMRTALAAPQLVDAYDWTDRGDMLQFMTQQGMLETWEYWDETTKQTWISWNTNFGTQVANDWLCGRLIPSTPIVMTMSELFSSEMWSMLCDYAIYYIFVNKLSDKHLLRTIWCSVEAYFKYITSRPLSNNVVMLD